MRYFQPRKGFTLIELMIVMIIIGTLISLLLTGIFRGREEAIKTECANNLRQCTIALFVYAHDNDGLLPGNISVLETEGYVPDDRVLKCPKTLNRYSRKYQADENIDKMAPSDELLACDQGTGAHNLTVYVDGHVE